MIAFSPNQTLGIILGMSISIVSMILLSKLVPNIIPSSFQFSRNNYLVGIIFSLVSTIALINIEVGNEPYVPYETGDLEPESTLIIPQTYREKPKVIPPPPIKDKPIVIPKTAPVIVPVEKLDEVITDESDIKEISDVAENYNVDSMMVATKMDAPEIIREDEEEEVIIFAEQMPRFPGCEEIDGNKDDKKKCADMKLLEFIYKNLKYPAIARENGVEGMAVLQFVVSETGEVTDAKIARDPGAGCGEAALKVVKGMNNLPEKWTPGKQRGRPVKVLYTLPVKFKLEG